MPSTGVMNFIPVHTVNLASSETVSNVRKLRATEHFFYEFTAPTIFSQQNLKLPSLFTDIQSMLQEPCILLTRVLVNIGQLCRKVLTPRRRSGLSVHCLR